MHTKYSAARRWSSQLRPSLTTLSFIGAVGMFGPGDGIGGTAETFARRPTLKIIESTWGRLSQQRVVVRGPCRKRQVLGAKLSKLLSVTTHLPDRTRAAFDVCFRFPSHRVVRWAVAHPKAIATKSASRSEIGSSKTGAGVYASGNFKVRHFAAPPDFMNSDKGDRTGKKPARCSRSRSSSEA